MTTLACQVHKQALDSGIATKDYIAATAAVLGQFQWNTGQIPEHLVSMDHLWTKACEYRAQV